MSKAMPNDKLLLHILTLFVSSSSSKQASSSVSVSRYCDQCREEELEGVTKALAAWSNHFRRGTPFPAPQRIDQSGVMRLSLVGDGRINMTTISTTCSEYMVVVTVY